MQANRPEETTGTETSLSCQLPSTQVRHHISHMETYIGGAFYLRYK